ncbi:MAG: molybdenum cofactor biosynthesis protein MoaE [Sulfolobales archaeon]
MSDNTCDDYSLYTRDQKIDFSKIINEISVQAAERGLGGVVIYIGVVKSPINNKIVKRLFYEIHEEYTLKRFSEIIKEIKRRHDVKCLKIYHVRGETFPGDIAVMIVAQAVGRKEAFEAVRETIDLVKHTTGIWKIEEREDGVFWILGEGERIPREVSKQA